MKKFSIKIIAIITCVTIMACCFAGCNQKIEEDVVQDNKIIKEKDPVVDKDKKVEQKEDQVVDEDKNVDQEKDPVVDKDKKVDQEKDPVVDEDKKEETNTVAIIDNNGKLNQVAINELPKEQLTAEQWGEAIGIAENGKVKITLFASCGDEEFARTVEFTYDGSLVMRRFFDDIDADIDVDVIDYNTNTEYQHSDKWSKIEIPENEENKIDIQTALNELGLDLNILAYSTFDYENGNYVTKFGVNDFATAKLSIKFYEHKPLIIKLETDTSFLPVQPKAMLVFEYENVEVTIPDMSENA